MFSSWFNKIKYRANVVGSFTASHYRSRFIANLLLSPLSVLILSVWQYILEQEYIIPILSIKKHQISWVELG